MNRTVEEQKKAGEMFDNFRDELLKRELSNTEQYDKTVLTLSTASLGFSLAVIKFITPLATATCTWLLTLSWYFLAISIILSLATYLISNKAIGIQLNNARDYYINGKKYAFSRKNCWILTNKCLNIFVGLLLALAILFILTFININMSTGEKAMSKDKSSNIYVEKSENISDMERVIVPMDSENHSANIPTIEQIPNTETTAQESTPTEDKK